MPTSPFPYGTLTLGQKLNNPQIDVLSAQRQQQAQQPQPAPGPSSTPDAMNVAPQPQTLGRIEHTHDIAGLAPQPITNQGPLAKAKIEPIQPSPAELSHQTEYNRLTGAGPDPSQGKPGWQQIHNPVLKTLGGIGNVAASLFPRIGAAIPGTDIHHQVLVGQEKRALDQEQGNRKATNEEQEQAARATNLEEAPELRAETVAAQNQLGLERLGETTRAHQATEDINKARYEGQNEARQTAADAALHREGYRKTADGDIEPIPYEEMSPQQQANHDLKSSQRELADATAALRKAQAEKSPEHESLAMQRLDIANRRLALSSRQFEMRAHGTEGGVPLPGSLLTDENKPVGTAFQQNVRPTGTERTRADLATSAHEQLNDMRDVIKRHPEFFGPGPGRKTQFVTWIGSQDPDAQKFLTARSILADHATGVFGARSEAAINAQKIAAGELKDNPDAILAGLNQIEKAMGTIKGKGVVKTTGSSAAAESAAAPVRARDPQGKLHEAPAGTPIPAGWKKE